MLQFLVLGLVPGTNIQINFNQIVDILALGVVIALYHQLRLRRIAEDDTTA